MKNSGICKFVVSSPNHRTLWEEPTWYWPDILSEELQLVGFMIPMRDEHLSKKNVGEYRIL